MNDGIRYTARYFDGRTARRQDVTISFGSDGISIYRSAGVLIAAWPASRVRLAERPRKDRPLIIGLENSTTRLVVENTDAIDALRGAIPLADRRLPTNNRNILKVAGWTTAAISAIVVLVLIIIPLLSDQLARQTPEPLKLRIGGAVLEQVVDVIAYLPNESKRAAYCTDRRAALVLRALASRLTADIPDPPQIRLVAVDAKLVNAFALPGGYVVVTSGLLNTAESPGEVAGVLAHEIGHVFYDHPTQAIYRSSAVALLVSAVLGDFTGGLLIGAVSEWVVNSSYSRSAEREADDFAIDRLNAAGISGDGFARFFERLRAEGQGDDGALQFISTHPGTVERLAEIRARTRGDGVALSAAAWKLLRQICSKTTTTPGSFPTVSTK